MTTRRATARKVDVREATGGQLDASVVVSVANPTVAQAIEHAIAKSIRSATPPEEGRTCRVVRLRTFARLNRLGPRRVAGRIVVVHLRARNAQRMPRLVEAIRAMDPAGVQLVWDGLTPSREAVDRHVFSVLEQARATPAGPPVVLAKSETPAFSLRVLAASRRARISTKKGRGA